MPYNVFSNIGLQQAVQNERECSHSMQIIWNQVQIKFKLLEHDERELKADELVTLSNAMYQIVLNSALYSIQQTFYNLKLENYQIDQKENHFLTNMLQQILQFVNIQNFQKVQPYLKHIQNDCSVIWEEQQKIEEEIHQNWRHFSLYVTQKSMVPWKKQQRSSRKKNKNKKYENNIINFQKIAFLAYFLTVLPFYCNISLQPHCLQQYMWTVRNCKNNSPTNQDQQEHLLTKFLAWSYHTSKLLAETPFRTNGICFGDFCCQLLQV
ncbi:Hypothetical_protein [Hexamita inflata]|uniref:Hypothetical_protein n=1 Tax=Hexamita inflata TaxID=28002 RepID=A0AA86QL15_9EUKA|nr:Hypothetical protein HINF_LOCUS49161 [Hexamita inflata]